jgi:hypothetical protein
VGREEDTEEAMWWLLVRERGRGEETNDTRALFSCKKFCKIDIIALSFVVNKYCPIID